MNYAVIVWVREGTTAGGRPQGCGTVYGWYATLAEATKVASQLIDNAWGGVRVVKVQ